MDNNIIAKIAMNSVQLIPEIIQNKPDNNKNTISLIDLAAMGTAFEQIVTAIQFVVNESEGKSGIYKVTVPTGSHLAKFKGSNKFLGSAINDVTNKVGAGQAAMTPLTCDPTILLIAVALAGIEKRFSEIEETQKNILNFLIQKEKSELRGNLNFLTEAMNNYKYRCNNEMFIKPHLKEILSIKRDSEKQIDFRRSQIETLINKKQFIHIDKDVRKLNENTVSQFQEYQLALYLYAFASFMDVMFSQDFNSATIQSIIDKIEKYSVNYRILYSKCYEIIEKNINSSLQSGVLKGLANANKFTGEVIAKIPVISKGQIDESLIKAGEKLQKIGENKNDKIMLQFISMKDVPVKPFIENMNMVKKLCSESFDIVFDNENIYIA